MAMRLQQGHSGGNRHRTPALRRKAMKELVELLESARGTLAPVMDQDWHGKWRIHRTLELTEKALTVVRDHFTDSGKMVSSEISVMGAAESDPKQPSCRARA